MKKMTSVTIFYVSRGRISDNGVRFQSNHLNFAAQEVAILTKMTEMTQILYFDPVFRPLNRDEGSYDHFLRFWGRQSDNDIYFYPSCLNFTASEMTIFTYMTHNGTNHP